MLVEAMISSAGSLRKSRSWMPRQISRVRGQVWIFDRARTTSGSARSISTRPSWTSFEISHRTIPEMLQVSEERIWRSFPVTEPRRAWIRMWVSRFSIPPQARGQEVAMHSNLACKTTDKDGRFGLDRHQLRYRLTVLCNDDTLRS